MSDIFSISLSRTDIKEAGLFLSALDKKAHKFVRHALNRSIKGVTTDTAKLVSKDFNVTQKEIKKTSKTYISEKGESNSVIFRGQKILAKHFSPRPNKRKNKQPAKGISIFLRKGEKFTIDGSFFGKSRKGVDQIYKRVGKPFYKNGRKTQHLAKPSLLSIPYMIKMSDIADEIQEGAIDRFNKNLKHNMKRALSKGI